MCFTSADHDPPPKGLTFLKDHVSGQPVFLDEDNDRVFEILDYSENQEERSRQCLRATTRNREHHERIIELENEPLGDAIRAASPFWTDISPEGIRQEAMG